MNELASVFIAGWLQQVNMCQKSGIVGQFYLGFGAPH